MNSAMRIPAPGAMVPAVERLTHRARRRVRVSWPVIAWCTVLACAFICSIWIWAQVLRPRITAVPEPHAYFLPATPALP